MTDFLSGRYVSNLFNRYNRQSSKEVEPRVVVNLLVFKHTLTLFFSNSSLFEILQQAGNPAVITLAFLNLIFMALVLYLGLQIRKLRQERKKWTEGSPQLE